MNVQAEPFTDVRVRQAVAHAINKEAIVHDLLRDSVDIADGPISPAYQWYGPDITVYEYDPDKARALLTEAGYSDGFTAKFDVPQSGSGMQLPIEMGTAIQADLAEVGITAEIEITDFNTWMDRIRAPEARFAEMSWNVPPVVEDDILSNVFGAAGMPPDGFNTSWYSNPDVEALLAQAKVTVDDNERGALLQEAQNLITEDCPAVFIDHAKIQYGISDELVGFNPGLDQQLRLMTVQWAP
jgi:peptide/nickel transport system substrate-binding protein